MSEDPALLARALTRERAARKAAEDLLEAKSRELFEARRREEALRREAERENVRLRSVSAALPDLLFVLDHEGSVRFAQPERPPESLLDGGQLDAVRAAAREALEVDAARDFDITLPDARVLEVRVRRVDPTEVLVVARDATLERALASDLVAWVDESRAARTRVEHALTDALDAVNAGFWETDLRTGRTSWSEGMYRLLGLPPSGVEPSSDLWRERTHPEDYPRVMAQTLEQTFAVEYRVVRPDGEIRWLRSRNSTVFDEAGAPVLLRGIATDVTDARAAAAQLARLAEVAGRTSNAVVVTDLSGRIEWVNDAFTRRNGYVLSEVLGKTPGSLLAVDLEDPAPREIMRVAIRERRPFDVEIVNRTKDGRQYWNRIEARVSLDEEGQPTGFVALESDVTEERFARAREALAQRVAAELLESDSVAAAGERVARELVKEFDILAAQFWVVDPSATRLVYVAGASTARAGGDGHAFLDATRPLVFRRGGEGEATLGIPGFAWALERTTRFYDFSELESKVASRRESAARQAGVATVFATPILGPTGVLGVIEVGGTRNYPAHERLPAIVERVAEQFAAFMLREASRRAFESIFERSPDALLLVDEAGRVGSGNSRARDLFGEVRGRAIDELIEGGRELIGRAGPSACDGGGAGPTLLQRDARGRAGTFSAEVSVAEAPDPADPSTIFAVRDLTERHRFEAALTASLEEKETLLREVHHRVKNNLQIVSSLLTLQAEGVAEPASRGALETSVHRVRSMSLVHQQLYGAESLGSVELGAYVQSLVGSLQSSVASDADFEFDLERVELSIDQAVPCGLILNELITNALKYGRDAAGQARLCIAVHPQGSGFEVAVTDGGPGMAQKPAPGGSLGYRLIDTLARQLRGKVSVTPTHPGTRVALLVPKILT